MCCFSFLCRFTWTDLTKEKKGENEAQKENSDNSDENNNGPKTETKPNLIGVTGRDGAVGYDVTVASERERLGENRENGPVWEKEKSLASVRLADFILNLTIWNVVEKKRKARKGKEKKRGEKKRKEKKCNMHMLMCVLERRSTYPITTDDPNNVIIITIDINKMMRNWFYQFFTFY